MRVRVDARCLTGRARTRRRQVERDGDETIEHQRQGARSGRLRICCPHCRSPFEIVVDAPLAEVTCSSCGNPFSLAGDAAESCKAPAVSTIAHFQLIERLGVGGFGTVWKARDTKLDRTVALKIPRQGQLDPSEAESFLREARVAAPLQHPHIVGVHEVGRDGERIYIVYSLGVILFELLTDELPFRGNARMLIHQVGNDEPPSPRKFNSSVLKIATAIVGAAVFGFTLLAVWVLLMV